MGIIQFTIIVRVITCTVYLFFLANFDKSHACATSNIENLCDQALPHQRLHVTVVVLIWNKSDSTGGNVRAMVGGIGKLSDFITPDLYNTFVQRVPSDIYLEGKYYITTSCGRAFWILFTDRQRVLTSKNVGNINVISPKHHRWQQ